jgi:nitrate/nitrite-specific signal transduction histidine kinase
VLVELLGEHHGAIPAGEFYDRLCAAVCRLTRLRRATLLLYDEAYQAVRAVGAYGVEPDLLRHLVGNLNETPVAQKALEDDDVVVFNDFSQVPERFRGIVDTRAIACVPVATGGRWLGVIFADRDGESFELDEGERLPLRTLGRAAALVASVEQATRERERVHQLDERIALTRELHEQVIQRLFALSLVLGAEGPLTEDDRARAAQELSSVLGELRGALERGLAPPERETKVTLRGLLGRLEEEDERVRVRWQSDVRVPVRLEPLTQSILSEALRNIGKHADPTEIAIEIGQEGDALILEVANDGAAPPAPGAGLGLRLASIEALRHEGVVEFGSIGGERWRVRLVCPLSNDDEDDGGAA